LAKAVWPAGLGRQVLDTVDSTNAHALRMAPELRGPMWFLGLTQTAGRGRRARPWVSPRGNFYGTLLLHPQEPPETVALRSFAAALALRDAFVDITGLPDSFALKWPNDVLLNGAKVAGILLESSGAGGRVDHLAIGIGVNLIAHPDPSLIEAGAVPAVSLLSETGLRSRPRRFWMRWPPPMPGVRRSFKAAASRRCAPIGWLMPPVWARRSAPAPARRPARACSRPSTIRAT